MHEYARPCISMHKRTAKCPIQIGGLDGARCGERSQAGLADEQEQEQHPSTRDDHDMHDHHDHDSRVDSPTVR